MDLRLGLIVADIESQVHSLSARFALTLTANGGSIQCAVGGGGAGPCAADYGAGTAITLTATPDANHVTGTWSSANNVCTGSTAANCTVMMSQDRTVRLSRHGAFHQRRSASITAVRLYVHPWPLAMPECTPSPSR